MTYNQQQGAATGNEKKQNHGCSQIRDKFSNGICAAEPHVKAVPEFVAIVNAGADCGGRLGWLTRQLTKASGKRVVRHAILGRREERIEELPCLPQYFSSVRCRASATKPLCSTKLPGRLGCIPHCPYRVLPQPQPQFASGTATESKPGRKSRKDRSLLLRTAKKTDPKNIELHTGDSRRLSSRRWHRGMLGTCTAGPHLGRKWAI